MKNGICYIFGAGDYYGPLPSPAKEDFVIAVDGGFTHLKAQDISADLLIGDFDSLQEPVRTLDTNIIVLPQEKDDTDTMAALQAGRSRGFRTFHIYGGTGGRLDHTLANIQCLAYLCQVGAQGFLFDRGTVITVISNSRIAFPAGAQGLISVFALSDVASGVCESGLKYPLLDAVLQNRYPVGISNSFTGTASEISVRDGTLIVIYPQDVTPIPMEKEDK